MLTREFNKLKVGDKVTLVFGRKQHDEKELYLNPSWKSGWLVSEGHNDQKEIEGEVHQKPYGDIVMVALKGGCYMTHKAYLK